MTSRVRLDGKYLGMDIGGFWHEFVNKPAIQGYYIQAFGSADASIDSVLQSTLRCIFGKSQDLINQLGRELNWLTICRILKNKKIMKEALYQRLHDFKKARNLVLHNMEAEYKLLDYNRAKSVDQISYDKKARERAEEVLRDGHLIWRELWEILGDLCEKRDAGTLQIS